MRMISRKITELHGLLLDYKLGQKLAVGSSWFSKAGVTLNLYDLAL